MSAIDGYPAPGVAIEIGDDLDRALQMIEICTSELHGPHNLILPNSGEVIVIGRTRVIPHGWNKQFGGGEMAGVMIYSQQPRPLPAHPDIWTALENVGLPRIDAELWEQRIVPRLSKSHCEALDEVAL